MGQNVIFEVFAVFSIVLVIVNFIFNKIKDESAVRFEKIMLEKKIDIAQFWYLCK